MHTEPLEVELAFASDTQEPMWVEALFLKSHQNTKATAMVFEDITRKKPKALYLLGDIVNLGYRNRIWKKVDVFLEKCRNQGIEIHALLGNHDLMGRPRSGERNFQKRFDTHVRTGYVQVTDTIAVVMLNSNFGSMTPPELIRQQAWYETTVEALDKHEEITSIIVTCHHPPYTNSKLVRSSREVQERFVPAYLASGKSRLFITGHSHAFERFEVKGKNFLVIGGAGGLRHPLRTDENRHRDMAPHYKPLFHYLIIKRAIGKLAVVSYALKPDFSAFEKGYEFELAFNPSPLRTETARGLPITD